MKIATWWLVGGLVASAAVAAGAYMSPDLALPRRRSQQPPRTRSVSGSIAPWIWTATLNQTPLGASSMVIGGSTLGLRNPITGEGTVDVIDAEGVQHRLVGFEFGGAEVPGEQLSPDGTLLASDGGANGPSGIEVLAVTDGTRRLVAPPHRAEWYTPLAWSPDQASWRCCSIAAAIRPRRRSAR